VLSTSSIIKVSVVVPTYNRCDALDETLRHLSYQQFAEPWEAIVVNNNCTDETDKVVGKAATKFPVPLRLVYEKKPGAAAARNAGARVAVGEYLVFIDNDILTETDFLSRHYRALRENPHSWIVGQVVNLPAQENSVFGAYRKRLFPIVPITEKVRETSAITGQTVSLPREHFIKLNGFDENFNVASGEDNEFAMRGRKQLGVKTLLAPDILVVHNDWAGWTFPDFCRRQEIYAQTEFFFWKKYGDEHPRQDLIKENLPVDWRKDSLKLLLRKKVKQILSNQIPQTILLKLCLLLEKAPPVTHPLLWRLYKLTLAGAIQRGFREGRERLIKTGNH
jgi:GT2 family glycosyltransferase